MPLHSAALSRSLYIRPVARAFSGVALATLKAGVVSFEIQWKRRQPGKLRVSPNDGRAKLLLFEEGMRLAEKLPALKTVRLLVRKQQDWDGPDLGRPSFEGEFDPGDGSVLVAVFLPRRGDLNLQEVSAGVTGAVVHELTHALQEKSMGSPEKTHYSSDLDYLKDPRETEAWVRTVVEWARAHKIPDFRDAARALLGRRLNLAGGSLSEGVDLLYRSYLGRRVWSDPMKITASDRSSLIRLASSLPKGDADRRAILAAAKTAAPYFPRTRSTSLSDSDSADLVQFGNAWAGLGPAIVSQVEEVLSEGSSAGANPNAIERAIEKIGGFCREIDTALLQWWEENMGPDEG